jgi:hypothetical protein
VNEESPYRVRAQRTKMSTRMVAVAGNPIDVVNRSTGEVIGATPYVGKRMLRDRSDFVKLYDPDQLVVLKPCELLVFMCALARLSFDGKFVFDEGVFMEKTGYARGNVYKGLRGLIEKDYVRKDKRGSYWVNPNIAYRGSRDELLV